MSRIFREIVCACFKAAVPWGGVLQGGVQGVETSLSSSLWGLDVGIMRANLT